MVLTLSLQAAKVDHLPGTAQPLARPDVDHVRGQIYEHDGQGNCQ